MSLSKEIASFRAEYTELSDPDKYPDSRVKIALRFAKEYNYGEYMDGLATAHVVVLLGSDPRKFRSAGSDPEAFWSATQYGRMWWNLWSTSGDSIATGFYGRS